jgi:2'-hydroxyisoflavone reductase
LKLLVLGGTQFLGRHVVDAALARRCSVTIFTRGRAPVPWAGAVERRAGNRDPDIAPGLGALAEGSWDAVIDTSGYLPRCVGASARLLAARVSHYLFVSSLSVYADDSTAGQDERAPLAELPDAASEDVIEHYGPLKAACERQVLAAFDDRATIVRAGLIVGPHDPTDRFSYWVARFLQPGLLGERGALAAVPAPPSRPVQFIDARDLAEWMLDLAAARVAGTFNACSPPGRWTFGQLVDALGQQAGTDGRAVAPAWIDEATILLQGIVPWTELPLWLPQSDPSTAGFMSFSCGKALGHGLSFGPIERTLADTSAWLAKRDNSSAWRNVLSAAKEAALLRAAPSG